MEILYCGACGAKNSLENKFCTACGTKLSNLTGDKDNLNNSIDGELNNDLSNKGKYEILQEKVLKLIENSGVLIVFVEDHFIQFQKDSGSYKLKFDLGKGDNIPQGYMNQIRAMNFEFEGENLNKTLTLTDTKDVIRDIIADAKIIFESIFKIQAQEQFKFEEYLESVNNERVELTEPNKTKTSAGCIIFIVILLIGLIGYCTKSGNTGENGSSQQETVVNSPYDSSVFQVEEYLKNQFLKDPDSYQSIEWSNVQIYSDSAYKYMVRHKFRAKNSFGGYVVANKLFYLDKDGNVVDVKEYKY